MRPPYRRSHRPPTRFQLCRTSQSSARSDVRTSPLPRALQLRCPRPAGFSTVRRSSRLSSPPAPGSRLVFRMCVYRPFEVARQPQVTLMVEITAIDVHESGTCDCHSGRRTLLVFQVLELRGSELHYLVGRYDDPKVTRLVKGKTRHFGICEQLKWRRRPTLLELFGAE